MPKIIPFGPGNGLHFKNLGSDYIYGPWIAQFAPRSVTAGVAITTVQGDKIIAPFAHRLRGFHALASGVAVIVAGTDPVVDLYRHLPPPTSLSVALISPAAAGNVDNGAHIYSVTFVNAAGETTGSAIATVTVTNKTVNGKVVVTIPIGPTGTTQRKIYRSAAAATTLLLLDTVANNTATTYTDNIADSSLGAGITTANTAAATVLTGTIKLSQTTNDRVLVDQILSGVLASDLVTDIWPAGTGYSLRAVTGASTGAITNLSGWIDAERVPD